ncbi:MAG TPA: hypothetical protein DCS29_01070 [Candidatus Magasanikbacteria bacterium]|nr:hypothetical protein [Candidatus Magasanikbacteria bacterium]
MFPRLPSHGYRGHERVHDVAVLGRRHAVVADTGEALDLVQMRPVRGLDQARHEEGVDALLHTTGLHAHVAEVPEELETEVLGQGDPAHDLELRDSGLHLARAAEVTQEGHLEAERVELVRHGDRLDRRARDARVRDLIHGRRGLGPHRVGVEEQDEEQDAQEQVRATHRTPSVWVCSQLATLETKDYKCPSALRPTRPEIGNVSPKHSYIYKKYIVYAYVLRKTFVKNKGILTLYLYGTRVIPIF